MAGLAGDLAATEDSTGAVTLQLANLHGDIVATAADDPAATGTTGYVEATEYGTPRPGNTVTPDRYGWLGAKHRSTDDLAGLVLMGVRLYNPATGRFLQVDPVPGGSAGPYLYPTNPIDGYDLNGQWWSWLKKAAHWAIQHRGTIATGIATGVCFIPAAGWATCGVAQAVAYGVRAQQRGLTHYRANAADALFTAASFGMGQALRAVRYARVSTWWGKSGDSEFYTRLGETSAARLRRFAAYQAFTHVPTAAHAYCARQRGCW